MLLKIADAEWAHTCLPETKVASLKFHATNISTLSINTTSCGTPEERKKHHYSGGYLA